MPKKTHERELWKVHQLLIIIACLQLTYSVWNIIDDDDSVVAVAVTGHAWQKKKNKKIYGIKRKKLTENRYT